MALGQCRECGREVSSEASHCPHCGVPRPLEEKKTGPIAKGFLGCLGLIILILVIGSLLPDSKNSSPPPASPIAPPPEPGSDFKAKQVAEQLIEDWKRGELGTEYWKD